LLPPETASSRASFSFLRFALSFSLIAVWPQVLFFRQTDINLPFSRNGIHILSIGDFFYFLSLCPRSVSVSCLFPRSSLEYSGFFELASPHPVIGWVFSPRIPKGPIIRGFPPLLVHASGSGQLPRRPVGSFPLFPVSLPCCFQQPSTSPLSCSLGLSIVRTCSAPSPPSFFFSSRVVVFAHNPPPFRGREMQQRVL